MALTNLRLKLDTTTIDRAVQFDTHQDDILLAPENTPICWHPGERFHHLYKVLYDDMGSHNAEQHVVAEFTDQSFSLSDLEVLTNQISHYLLDLGIEQGDCIAVLFDRSLEAYASLLAISQVGAAFVPLDRQFPQDRIKFIVEDCHAVAIVSMSAAETTFSGSAAKFVALDSNTDIIQRMPTTRPVVGSDSADDLAYIIYTSGTTGNPKGVKVNHSSICNFLRVAKECYGFTSDDRVFQSLTFAFDYSFEEIWVPLLSGSRLVPAPAGVNLVGQDLEDFLIDKRITAYCSVPTVLATIEGDLPDLRLLIVSGEACPKDLADRWSAGRRMLNLYGPTETTVSCSWGVIEPDSPITIGKPLPTYSMVVLNDQATGTLPRGEVGELAFGGPGVTDGYLNRASENQKAFIDDFVGLPDNPGKKLYRTGDLGSITQTGNIAYIGRRDTQVKIRGYRIELAEIEEVARTVSNINSVAVTEYRSDLGAELVAWFACADDQLDVAAVQKQMARHLPPYMVPSYYETIDSLPLQASGKVDRKALPAPSQNRLTNTSKPFVEPREGLEQQLASLLANILKVERVSADADFFSDLSADSLIMARFLSRVHRELNLKKASMSLIYQNMTVIGLAQALAPAESSGKAADPAAAGEPLSDEPEFARYLKALPDKPEHIASRLQYILCGCIQGSYMLLLSIVTAFATIVGWNWLISADALIDIYTRAVISGGAYFVGLSALQIAIKWLAIGRFTETEIPVWSVTYARFWIAQSAIRANPLNMFIGTPVYTTMLRLMGANIGKGTLIYSMPPVCTDLITIGDNTLIRQDCSMPGYTVHRGWLRTGPVTIGDNAFISEATALEINTSMGDNTQLGRVSALLEGQAIPDGQIWHGNPARQTTTDYIQTETGQSRLWAGRAFTAGSMAFYLLWTVPFALITAMLFLQLAVLPGAMGLSAGWTIPLFITLGYFALLLLGLINVTVMPKVYNYFFISEKTHPLFGFQYWLATRINATSNSTLLQTLFGDSSLIMPYYKAVGYDLKNATQNGSNFGVQQRQHSPFLCKFNRNTLLADGVAILNMDLSTANFSMKRIEIAPDAYLGNDIHYPTGAKIGADCLIATKALVPTDGPIREGMGILGSPPIEIPRTVARDNRFDHYKQPDVFEERLAMKLTSNIITIGLFLLRNISALVIIVLVASWLFSLTGASGDAPLDPLQFAIWGGVFGFISFTFSLFYYILFEHLILLGKPMKPTFCSLYERPFWNHERFWKMNVNSLFAVFDGTPMKGVIVRAQGVKTGSMVFDNGCSISEPYMVEIGDRACLNFGSTIQGHSLEDGTFKSDHIKLGHRVTVGGLGFVHYGAVIEDDAVVEAHSFVMKGSVIGKAERWCGNPAQSAGVVEGSDTTGTHT